MENTTTNTDVFKQEETHVKKDEKKSILAKYYKMLVETNVSLEGHMGKPMSAYNFEVLKKVVDKYEEEKKGGTNEIKPKK